ncbi:MAG: sporulation/spore germination protein [Cyanobacteria bacterium J06621_11]
MVRLQESIQTRISRLAPYRHRHSLFTGLALTLTVAIAGCATSPDQVVVEPSESPAPEVVETPKGTLPSADKDPNIKDQPVESQPNSPAGLEKQPAGSGEMVTVSVYTIDDQCDDFVAQPVEVPSNVAINEAVGKVMSQTELNAFKLEGYQVNIDGNTATVDMRLASGSERQFVSLSSCEQRSLFGSVEETLLNNASWDVDAVKFTNAGKEIVL